MFLHIISILLYKIHPYFSQYAAYLRNMRIIKIVSTRIRKFEFATSTQFFNIYYLSIVKSKHQSRPSTFNATNYKTTGLKAAKKTLSPNSELTGPINFKEIEIRDLNYDIYKWGNNK